MPRLWKNLLVVIAVAALLALHAWMSLSAKRHWGLTVDEPGVLAAGNSYLTTGDYRLNPEGGVLAQLWMALPMRLQGEPGPDTESVHWRRCAAYSSGQQLLFGGEAPRYDLLYRARAMNEAFACALGLLIFLWSRKFFGTRGAFLSLGAYVFCPNFLAHGSLATIDVPMSLMFLAVVGAYWQHLSRPSGLWLLLSCVTLGLACVTKFSAILLVPVFVLLGLIRVVLPEPLIQGRLELTRPGSKLAGVAGSLVLHAGVTILVIWAFYGFRYSAFNPALPRDMDFVLPWAELRNTTGVKGELIRKLAELRALPEAFLYGLNYVLDSTNLRSAYLDGEYSYTGWWNFFPLAFAYKTPVGLLGGLLLVATLLGASLRRSGQRRARALGLLRAGAPLLVFTTVYWAVSMGSNLNIGHRHLLPVYPALFIALGYLGSRNRGKGLIGALLALPVLVIAAESLAIRPHYLAFFNAPSGGAGRGDRHLVDSSLDWGQDLPGLRDRMASKAWPGGAGPVYLAYFGADRPAAYGLPVRNIKRNEDMAEWAPLQPGTYVVSATELRQVYGATHGEWTESEERQLALVARLWPAFEACRAGGTGRTEVLARFAEPKLRSAWHHYEDLRLARLCHALARREPELRIGYSIYVYKIGAGDPVLGP